MTPMLRRHSPPLAPRFTLLLLVLAGTALRLFRLGAESFWYDETVSVFLAGSPVPELLRHTAADIHPPGYYLLLRGWLITMGYPTGHADPSHMGLEFAAGFLSLSAGVLLIAMTYTLAHRFAGQSVALLAAAFVAFSPYNIWYSQEVRMYTLGALLGVLALYAMLRAAGRRNGSAGRGEAGSHRLKQALALVSPWWLAYALAAACGLYTLYYFAFLLLAINVWFVAQLALAHGAPAGTPLAIRAPLIAWPAVRAVRREPVGRGHAFFGWFAANLAVVFLYLPWLPAAWRQAIDPPVPPWRTGVAALPSLAESWAALSIGQSAPGWLWPALAVTAGLYMAGMVFFARRRGRQRPATEGEWLRPSTPDSPVGDKSPATGVSGFLLVANPFLYATFGSLGLVLVGSSITPLYHVRYVFTYSPAFYVVIAAGLSWLWQRRRPVALLAAVAWLAASAIALQVFWAQPAFPGDDHRSAVRFLQSQWRPGDAVLVNSGYAYTALLTYWDGPVAWRGRLTGEWPGMQDDALVAVLSGQVDGPSDLGWNDAGSDFYAMSSEMAKTRIAALFRDFPRVWHFRIYDTVSDPAGLVRGLMSQEGQIFADQVFAGEANMRVQGFVSRTTFPPQEIERLPEATIERSLVVRIEPLPREVPAGQSLYPMLYWQVLGDNIPGIATSIRLIGQDGTIWAQPPDERPAGPLYPPASWPSGQAVRQPLALPIPLGTPPGEYTVELVIYDPTTGQALPFSSDGTLAATPNGLDLGRLMVRRPDMTPSPRAALARFGPLSLIEAGSPATQISPGSQVPVELLWQANSAPGEPLVVVVQLLDPDGRVAAGLEAQPLDGRYPTQGWQQGELVRDRHALELPRSLKPGAYRLVVGLYTASNGNRLPASLGLWRQAGHFVIKSLTVN